MPLHPQAQAMINSFAGAAALDFETLTARGFRDAFSVPTPSTPGCPLVRVEDQLIQGPAGPLRVRLYHPPGHGPFPVTVYLHGGGFVVGGPETTDGLCRSLASGARSVVVSPDYRLAPEAPFPHGLLDAWATLQWSRETAAAFGGDPSKIAVAGDSSGGNFAAVLAQMARDHGLPLQHQVLLYPVMDHRFDTLSYRAFATGYFLSAAMMRWFWQQYLPQGTDSGDWRVSPLRRDSLQGLAPATILTAEFDVLRDEAEAYAVALASAGVQVTWKRWPGQIHGFLLQQGTMDDANAAIDAASRALRASFL
jgi:acetyl esterase